MKPEREQIELENMALTAELSRQLAHDFSNFVYHLLLQIEIWETVTPPRPADWKQIKKEAREMAGLLKGWERFHGRCSAEEPTKTDLHQLIRQMVKERSPRDCPVQLAPAILAEPLWFTSCALAVKHLLLLLLEEAANPRPETTAAPVSVATEKTNETVIVRMQTLDETDKGIEAHPTSLLEATCRTLAQRLDATLEREQANEGQALFRLELPLKVDGVR
jgi:hypothetical protein